MTETYLSQHAQDLLRWAGLEINREGLRVAGTQDRTAVRQLEQLGLITLEVETDDGLAFSGVIYAAADSPYSSS